MYQPDLAIGEQNTDAYQDPLLDSNAEIDSMNYQAKAFNSTQAPKELPEALLRLEDLYSKCRWQVRPDFGSLAHITEVAEFVSRHAAKKSPGAIFLRMGHATNADVFNALGVAGVVNMVQKRIHQLNTTDPRYAADPIRLFVKREPHKKSKVLEKRWRLIWGISLIDQIVDRLLYAPVVNRALENAADIPSKPGYSFKYGGYNRMVLKYQNGSRKWISFDAKSFDMTVAGWKMEAVRELNERLCTSVGTPEFEEWCRLSKNREQAVLYGCFVFSNGVVCRKTKPGIQPSGRFTTIDGNCKIVTLLRVLDDVACGRPTFKDALIAMGDDTVQDGLDDPQGFVDRQRDKYGVTMTVESQQGEFKDQNFCSTETHEINGVFVPVPLNWAKNTYELCHPEAKVAKTPAVLRENRGSALQSLCCEYAFHPRFSELHKLLATYNPDKMRSAAYFQGIVTGHENASAQHPRWEEFQCDAEGNGDLDGEETAEFNSDPAWAHVYRPEDA